MSERPIPIPWGEPPYTVPTRVGYWQVRQVGEPLEDGAVVLVDTDDDTMIWYFCPATGQLLSILTWRGQRYSR